MDPVLARMFDLDRPTMERVEDLLLQRNFVKTASAEGYDLNRLPDGAIGKMWGSYLADYNAQKRYMAKEAEAVRIGRELARRMARGWIQKHAQAQAEALRKLDPDYIDRIIRFLGQTPDAQKLLRQNPNVLENLALGGLDEKRLMDLSTLATQDPDTTKFWVEQMKKKHGPDLAQRQMEYATHRAGWKAPGTRIPLKDQEVFKNVMGTMGEDMKPSMLQQFSPAGIGQAIKGKQWGSVAKKLGPIGLAGAGALYMLGNRSERNVMQNATPGRVPAY